MNRNSDGSGALGRLRAFIGSHRADRPTVLIIGSALILGFILVLFFGPGLAFSKPVFAEVEPGRVAEKDLVADRELSYVDEKATELRIEAEERLVLPIFVVDEKVAESAFDRFHRFQDLLLSLAAGKIAPDTLYLRIQSQFPGLLSKEEILDLARFPLRSQAFTHADAVLRHIMERGLLSLPGAGLEHYNGDYVELRRIREGRIEYEELPSSRVPTLRTISEVIEDELAARRITRPLSGYVALLAKRHVVENAFFDAAQSQKRLDAVRKRVEPVVRNIARGERLVKKGFIISEADFAKLEAARQALARPDWGRLAGDLGFYLAISALALLILGPRISGSKLKLGELALAAFGCLGYLGLAYFGTRLLSLSSPLSIAQFLPSALFAMLFALLAGQRFAVLYSLVLALLVLLASGFDSRPFALALLSGAAGAFAARSADSRIDLVRAGALLALLQAFAAALLASPLSRGALEILLPMAWSAANGLFSAFLCLGILPILEQALNVPTRFRLMELSDLNAPILKRLLTVAPGTYSHSVTVAHLAESACREIGADPLIARVGAYYHDIGKIEQPEYFVENQAGYNKHDEINPRLSATVIRSHVKLGVEKVRALGLPQEVVDIVAQHHGNGVITWFYDKASKEDSEADPEDFSYPGLPPASREAAVVMLADSVEAASRSLKRPTLARLDSLIKDIVMDKVTKGQLDRSELTFKDLETIRNTFARILAGHFHSRIEYPKIREGTK